MANEQVNLVRDISSSGILKRMLTREESISADLYVSHFQMKDDQPLNKRKITVLENNVKIPIAALHTNWKDPRCFTKYCFLGIDFDCKLNLANKDKWINETTWFIKDMKHLLGLEYHIFWSTIVYNLTALESVLSFVQNALPIYLIPELNTTEEHQAFSLYLDARSCVFKVICRFTVLRENPGSWMNQDFFADLLYKHFIVTVPFMLDIIAIYGRDNKEVSRIIELILTIQPKYMQDCRQGIHYLMSVFTVIQGRCESDLSDFRTEAILNDLALYAQECAYTLSVMVEISPILRQLCSDLNTELAISNFYDNAVLVLYKKIQEANQHSSFLDRLNDTRIELLEAFRSIVTVQLDRILSSSGDNILAADKFISILTECLADNGFVNDYKRRYETEKDLKIVRSGFKSVDKVKFDFIWKAYAMDDKQVKGKKCKQNQPGEHLQNAHNTKETDQEKQRSVQTIIDLLPHLDVEHVRNVLDCYGSVEEAIAALLEQSYPAEKQNAAPVTDEVCIPLDPLDEFYLKTGVDRLNIYDGDEFDVMVNDKVKGIIKKGKGMPGAPKTSSELLDDKSHIKQTRHIYQQYDMIATVDPDDDEYDDSFEAMAESESRHVKMAKGSRNVLVDDGPDNDSESDNQGTSEQETNRKQTAFAFCENPEIARKRYEEKLKSRYLHRHGASATGIRECRGDDVRGKPKGQGQDAKVLQNRKNKNEHKATVGNHNRKQGASYKRSRAMF